MSQPFWLADKLLISRVNPGKERKGKKFEDSTAIDGLRPAAVGEWQGSLFSLFYRSRRLNEYFDELQIGSVYFL